jgi:hypothetical protein
MPNRIEKEINAFLDRYSAAFTDACRQVLANPIPDDALYGLIWFQIDDPSWEHFPLCHAWCDRQGGVAIQHPSPLTIAGGDWMEPEGLDDDQLGEVIFRWIHRCWQAADGAAAPLPVYCHNYHTDQEYCLRRGRFVTPQEIDADLHR